MLTLVSDKPLPAVTIRPSTPDDATHMLAMEHAAYLESGWEKDECAFDADSFLVTLDHVAQHGLTFVADNGERAVGMIGATIAGMAFNHAILTFRGVFWYCEPEYRRHSMQLLDEIEKAAKARGVIYGVVGVDDGARSAALSRLYQRAGYRPAEHVHLKRL